MKLQRSSMHSFNMFFASDEAKLEDLWDVFGNLLGFEPQLRYHYRCFKMFYEVI